MRFRGTGQRAISLNSAFTPLPRGAPHRNNPSYRLCCKRPDDGWPQRRLCFLHQSEDVPPSHVESIVLCLGWLVYIATPEGKKTGKEIEEQSPSPVDFPFHLAFTFQHPRQDAIVHGCITPPSVVSAANKSFLRMSPAMHRATPRRMAQRSSASTTLPVQLSIAVLCLSRPSRSLRGLKMQKERTSNPSIFLL